MNVRSRGLPPLLTFVRCPPWRRSLGFARQEHEHGGNHRKHGQGTAREDRRADDGMQEGPDRSRRRHGQGRGNPARQAGQQGQQGRLPRGRRGHRRQSHRSRCQAGRDRRGQLRNRLRRQERRLLRLLPRPWRSWWRSRTRPTSPRCRRLPLGEATVEATRSGAGGQDRREHVDPPLRPLRGQGQADQLHPRRRQDRRTGRRGRRRRAAGQGSGHAHRRLQAEGAGRVGRVGRPAGHGAPHRVEKAREAGKPEAMLEKIAEGTVQKYLKEVTLLGQVFVKAEDGKQTIEQLLKAKGASVAASRCSSLARASRRRSTTSPPKWRPRPLLPPRNAKAMGVIGPRPPTSASCSSCRARP
jgi:hypothetical protein